MFVNMANKFDFNPDISRTLGPGQWEHNNNSMWPSTSDPSSDRTPFSPYHDYLGLAQLVTRICGNSESGTDATFTQHSAHSYVPPPPTNEEEDVFTDFRNNGREGVSPFAPFSVEAAMLEDRQRGLRSSRLLSASKPRCTPTWCVFCKNNGESEMVYASHILKDGNGKITCPILRAYTCPLCGASGDYAHTIKYCPTTKGEVPPAPLKTARTSTGRKRTQTQSSQTINELFM